MKFLCNRVWRIAWHLHNNCRCQYTSCAAQALWRVLNLEWKWSLAWLVKTQIMSDITQQRRRKVLDPKNNIMALWLKLLSCFGQAALFTTSLRQAAHVRLWDKLWRHSGHRTFAVQQKQVSAWPENYMHCHLLLKSVTFMSIMEFKYCLDTSNGHCRTKLCALLHSTSVYPIEKHLRD